MRGRRQGEGDGWGRSWVKVGVGDERLKGGGVTGSVRAGGGVDVVGSGRRVLE